MLVGITGTLGAGKGTVVEYLVQKRGMKHFSVRDFLIEEIRRRGMPINRDSMVLVADDLRRTYRPSHIVEQLHARAMAHMKDAIIESVRALAEAHHLKSQGAQIWAVDADPAIRYQRIVARASETDRVSFEKFLADEEREFRSIDPARGNIHGVMKMADVVLQNNGSRHDLHLQIERVLG